jgi:RPA family protein
MQDVSSGNLNQVGFDPDLKKIRIVFNSGAVYEYSNCSQEEADQIIAAASPNDAFNALLRGVKPYQRIAG